jgi:hypothetical protein
MQESSINCAVQIQFKLDSNLAFLHLCLRLQLHSEPVPQQNVDKVWKVRRAHEVATAP